MRYSQPFDQVGLMLGGGPELWLKTGIDRTDGQLYASVVVTAGMSDWSVAPLPRGAGESALTFRASRPGDGITLRYRSSPTPAGLSVRFEPVRVGLPDASLHESWRASTP